MALRYQGRFVRGHILDYSVRNNTKCMMWEQRLEIAKRLYQKASRSVSEASREAGPEILCTQAQLEVLIEPDHSRKKRLMVEERSQFLAQQRSDWVSPQC
jgi:hypothetical protein